MYRPYRVTLKLSEASSECQYGSLNNFWEYNSGYPLAGELSYALEAEVIFALSEGGGKALEDMAGVIVNDPEHSEQPSICSSQLALPLPGHLYVWGEIPFVSSGVVRYYVWGGDVSDSAYLRCQDRICTTLVR